MLDFAWRDGGNLVGAWRMIEFFDRRDRLRLTTAGAVAAHAAALPAGVVPGG